MKVKHWMTQNPLTVKPSTFLPEAAGLMKEHGIRRLPVVDKGRVVGMLTQRHLLEASPSAATTLSVHELNYLISNLKVSEVMQKDPVCVNPEDSAIDVVLMGHQKKIGAFPVVDKGRLVGIVTETEIFRVFVALFGNPQEETMISLERVDLENNLGEMSKIASLAEDAGVPVMAIMSLPQRRYSGHRVYLRVKTKEPADFISLLEKNGYNIGS